MELDLCEDMGEDGLGCRQGWQEPRQVRVRVRVQVQVEKHVGVMC